MSENKTHLSVRAFLRKGVQHILWRIEVFFYDFAVFVLHIFPVEGISSVFGRIFQIFGRFSKRHHFAEKSMLIAFPNSTKEQRKVWLAGMWDNMGRILGEFLSLERLSDPRYQNQFEIEIAPETEAFVKQKYPVIFLSGHFANWEILPISAQRLAYPCQGTYRAMNNPYFDNRVKALRQKIGAHFLTPKSGLRGALELVQTLRQGRSLFFMGDQKYNEGFAAPFFGQEVMTQIAPLRLALKTETPIIPIIHKRKKGLQTKLIFYKPLFVGKRAQKDLERKPEEEKKRAAINREGSEIKTHFSKSRTPREKREVTEEEILTLAIKLNQFYEDRIREAPQDWFWLHRRWPKELYREERKV